MTETTPATHINPFAGGARKVGSIGIPIPDTLARIVDLEDEVTDVPVGFLLPTVGVIPGSALRRPGRRRSRFRKPPGPRRAF
jgi:acyl-CoA synthetase (AMP-forming)/AMP-acid ligase II